MSSGVVILPLRFRRGRGRMGRESKRGCRFLFGFMVWFMDYGLYSKRARLMLEIILGGSQTMAYGTPASRFADMRPFVAASVAQGQPIIAVALNYRLSIFAFGDGEGEGEFNLALKDQRVGIEWVRRYIDAFGGDPDQITLAGESAGAVYVHGHLFTGAPVKRAVLMSGHLPLSPPLPRGFAGPLLEKLVKKAEEGGYAGGSLREVKVDELVGYVREVGWPSMWLQQEGELAKWKIGEEGVEELLIGDCEYEVSLQSVVGSCNVRLLTWLVCLCEVGYLPYGVR